MLLILILGAFLSCSKEDNDVEKETASEVVASADFVSVDWTKTDIKEYNEVSGEMKIAFQDAVPYFSEGRSLIVVETDTSSRIRRVMSVEQQSVQEVILQTQEATMADLFPGQTFALLIEPPSSVTSKNKLNDGITYYPMAVEVMTSGGYRTVLAAQVNSRTEDFPELLMTDVFFHYNSDHSGDKLSGRPLFPGKPWSPTMKKCVLESTLYSKFYFQFGRVEKEIFPDLKVESGELLSFFYYLSGNVNFDFLLRMEANGTEELKGDPVILKKNLMPPFRFRFMVGGVPVFISVKTDLMAESDASLAGEVAIEGGFSAGASVKAGISWYKDNGFHSDLSQPEVNFTLYKPVITGKGNYTLKTSIYPRIHLFLYEFAGGQVDFKPYLANELKVGLRGESGGQSYFSMIDTLFAGMDYAGKVSLLFAGKELMAADVPSAPVSLFRTSLFVTPAKIEVNAKDKLKPVAGTPLEVTFNVSDFSFSGQTYGPTLLGFVNFRTQRGRVNFSTGLVVNGKSTVRWIPSANGDKLWGELLNAEGNVVAVDSVVYKGPGIIGHWVVTSIYRIDHPSGGGGAEGYIDPAGEYLTLNEGGKGVWGDNFNSKLVISWQIIGDEGNRLGISDDEGSETYIVEELTDTRLVLTYADHSDGYFFVRTTYKRVE